MSKSPSQRASRNNYSQKENELRRQIRENLSRENAKREDFAQKACPHYNMNNWCAYGDKCRYSHGGKTKVATSHYPDNTIICHVFGPLVEEDIGFMVGRKGQTVQMVKNRSLAFVELQPAQPDQERNTPWFLVKGTETQVDAAVRLLKGLAKEARSRNSSDGMTTEQENACDKFLFQQWAKQPIDPLSVDYTGLDEDVYNELDKSLEWLDHQEYDMNNINGQLRTPWIPPLPENIPCQTPEEQMLAQLQYSGMIRGAYWIPPNNLVE